MTIAFHPYVELFPLIDGHEFYELAEDIRWHGLKDRITLLCGSDRAEILDGRNRFRSLVWIMSTGAVLGPGWAPAGLQPGDGLTANEIFDIRNERLYWLFDPARHGDALAFVLSKNLSRRHLSESQRAIVAGRLANIRPRGRMVAEPSGSAQQISTAAAAAALNVSKRSAARGRKVVQFALPEVTEAVERGRIKVSVAEHIAAQAPARQAEIIASWPQDAKGRLTLPIKRALQPVIREIRAQKQAAKAQRRLRSETGRTCGLPSRTFGIAVDDFEWDDTPCPGEGRAGRQLSMPRYGADEAYCPDEIVARRAERFACLADDCILFTWTAIWCLDLALQVQQLQGFRYVTSLVWTKAQSGEVTRPGDWFSPAHELVLVGVRGRVTPPAAADLRSSLLSKPGNDDGRPDELHEIIDAHWPDTPKVEFHAPRARPGWAVWRPVI